MNLSDIKHTITHHLINIPGWHTKRKIVVIESDDWGSIRMPSRKIYKECLRSGYPVDRNPYERFDSLASKEDLELLFNLLLEFKDHRGVNPIITANCVVANPDFEKIKENDFQQYFFELITTTFQKYPEHSNNLNIWKEANNSHLFHPQYHAREHLNVSKFMKDLQNKNEDVLYGFQKQMPGCIRKGKEKNGNFYVEATYYDSAEDKHDKLNIYKEGLTIFNDLFGYNSESIIPPNYTWDEEFDKEISKMNVKYIQGIRKMRQPCIGKKPIYKKRYLGQNNKYNQINLVRNVFFEPTLTQNNNQVNKTLMQIEAAFRMKKPAIISSHRINYVGYIDKSNRDKNLFLLKKLLNAILRKWPDVEFMTSDELGKLIIAH